MKMLRVLCVGLALVWTTPAVVHAQQVDPAAEARAVATWSEEALALLNEAMAPLENMPEPPADFRERRAVRAWIEASRGWLAEARAANADIARRFAQLRPPPVVTGSRDAGRALQEQHRRLPTVIASFDDFYGRYASAIEAFERNDPRAILAFSANAVDAMMLPLASLRDINDMTAAAVEPGLPQAFWLRSVARSYDAMLAYMLLIRESLTDAGPRIGLAVEAMETANRDMQREIDGGRAAIVDLREKIATARAGSAEEAAILRKIDRANRTFSSSFDLEARLLDQLSKLAAYLGAPGQTFSPGDPVPGGYIERIGDLDKERANEQAVRLAILAEP